MDMPMSIAASLACVVYIIRKPARGTEPLALRYTGVVLAVPVEL